ncbi:MAG: radical SAM protein [Gammaproteobacteria bacterium]|nr:radical SAM protein [Gammaproteobacteria bacterium]
MYSTWRHLPALILKRQPIQLTFFLTRRCNARCPFCFYLQNNDDDHNPGILKDNNKLETSELNLQEICRISQSLGKLLWLAFSGGEIYLRKDLIDISRLFYKQNKPVIMLYPTNGLMPELIRERTEQILQQCPNSVIAVKLSIDELGEAHDCLRNTPHSFEKTMKTYQLLAPLLAHYPNFELGINTVFCADNQHNMDALIDFVASLEHIQTHSISMIRGNLKNNHFKSVDYKKYVQATERLAENIKKKKTGTYRFKGAKLKTAQDILQRRLIYRTLTEKKRQIPCYAGRTNLVLSETGEVYACEMLSHSFGNVRDFDYDIRRVLQTEQAQHGIASIKAQQCFCSHECYFMTNILLNPTLYPALAKIYLSQVMN